MRRARLRGGALLAALALSLAGPAAAETGLLLADASSADSANLETGQQLLIADRTGELLFAGRRFALEGFTGVVGYANELAYITVIDGSIASEGVRAERGWMLMAPPYGGELMRERFDAVRFAEQWSAAARAASPEAYASLESISRRQRLGLFFGRYGQTGFNVAASGSVARERVNRNVLGAEAVREVRFSGESDAAAIERRVVSDFLNALGEGDAETVAALLDPTLFGGRALSGGAREARLAAAYALIESRDWRAAVGAGEPAPDGGYWRAGAVRVALRQVEDFTFVRAVQESGR